MLKLKSINETIQGNIIYMLILIVLVQTIYPITLRGGVFLIGYQLLYAAMFAVGVYISRDSWWHVIVTGSLALLFLIFGIAFALDPESTWKINIT